MNKVSNITHSSILSPFDQSRATLTGISLLVRIVKATFAFVPPDIDETSPEGVIRRWYWGFNMKEGYVQFPPEFLLVKTPSIWKNKKFQLRESQRLTCLVGEKGLSNLLVPCSYQVCASINSQCETNLGRTPVI